MAINTFLSGTSGTTFLNWGSTSSWSLGTVPTRNGDTIAFTSSSATCSLNIAGTCSILDFTAYNKQFRFNANALAVFGNVTFNPQMSFSFSTTTAYNAFNLAIASSSTITTNGCTVGVPLTFFNFTPANNTYTLADRLVVAENFSTAANAGSLTHSINGNYLDCYKNCQFNLGTVAASTNTAGNATVSMVGAATGAFQTGVASSAGTTVNIIFDKNGIISLSGNLYWKNCTIYYINGNITGNFSLFVTGNWSLSATGSNANNLFNLTLRSQVLGTTWTLLSDVHLNGSIITNGNTINGNRLYVYSGQINNITTITTGTSELVVAGTASSSSVNLTATTAYSNSIRIDTPGTCVFSTNVFWSPIIGATFTYARGTVTFPTPTNCALSIGGTNPAFLDTGSMSFFNVQCAGTTIGGHTYSLITPLNVSNILSINSTADHIFTGNFGFSASTLQNTANPTTTRRGIQLKSGLTYSVGALNLFPATNAGTIQGIRSTTAGQQANLVLLTTSQSNTHVITNDINSNAGNTVWVWNWEVATASVNTNNWRRLQANNIDWGSSF